jgi:hypothetical protein
VRDQQSWITRCAASADRSRERRAAARRLRRRRLRWRGGGASLTAVALAVAAMGVGAALGNSVGAPSGSVVAASQGLLARGSQGTAVQVVQRALGLNPTGFFGPVTEAHVRDFQRRRGLLVDGIVGPQTRGALGLGGSAPVAGVQGQAGTGTPQSTAAPVIAQGSSGASGALQRIAQCESGGNPRSIGAGGRYRGKYQFTRETWQAVGGSGDPAAAPVAEQDRRAATLLARGGSSSWPRCG